jgi:hypothetical protein
MSVDNFIYPQLAVDNFIWKCEKFFVSLRAGGWERTYSDTAEN